MNSRSFYWPLRWIVQVKDAIHPWWETMAAFNHDGVALDYADKCRKGAIARTKEFAMEYRVMKRVGRGSYVEITKEGQ